MEDSMQPCTGSGSHWTALGECCVAGEMLGVCFGRIERGELRSPSHRAHHARQHEPMDRANRTLEIRKACPGGSSLSRSPHWEPLCPRGLRGMLQSKCEGKILYAPPPHRHPCSTTTHPAEITHPTSCSRVLPRSMIAHTSLTAKMAVGARSGQRCYDPELPCPRIHPCPRVLCVRWPRPVGAGNCTIVAGHRATRHVARYAWRSAQAMASRSSTEIASGVGQGS